MKNNQLSYQSKPRSSYIGQKRCMFRFRNENRIIIKSKFKNKQFIQNLIFEQFHRKLLLANMVNRAKKNCCS